MNCRRGSSGRDRRPCADDVARFEGLGAVVIGGETVYFDTERRPIRAGDRVVACIRLGTDETTVLCVGDAVDGEDPAGELADIRVIGGGVAPGRILGRLVPAVQAIK
ncbi:hypothetical protein [Fodinicurvata sp. EGI_FJ10296]|uniref:hypothetical protein n=1 Tax=Fodinicurvata sp. EGI_FJ10296 TaxID=3231908 RepID=UPI0034518A9A